MNAHLGECLGIGYSSEHAQNFARIVSKEEEACLKHLMALFPNHPNVFIHSFEKLLKNTLEINDVFQEISQHCQQQGVDTILQFGSSVFGKNYSVGDHTDLDIEIVVDDSFDISSISSTVLAQYSFGNIEDDFHDFLKSEADYFSFKASYQ